ncbi:MAG TPA: hypothetical protein VF698_17915 [Thermoanaerobaculia bacterium]
MAAKSTKGSTERLAVFLKPEQIEWLKGKGENVSETVRALVTEAMNMDRLAESVRKPSTKKPAAKPAAKQPARPAAKSSARSR